MLKARNQHRRGRIESLRQRSGSPPESCAMRRKPSKRAVHTGAVSAAVLLGLLGTACSPAPRSEDGGVVEALQSAGSLVVPVVASEEVQTPSHANEGVVLALDAGTNVTIGLPNAGGAAPPQNLADGSTAFPNEDGTTQVVRETPGGTQLLTVAEDASAPTRYAYDFGLPAGSFLQPDDAGGVAVETGDGAQLAYIEPPFAVDANGLRVPTHYEVNGTSLTQVVSLSEPGLAFPVVLDPQVSTNHWWGSQTWYSRSHVRAYASWYGAINIAKAVCDRFNSVYKAVCKKTVGKYTSWIYDTWMEAKRRNQCVTMKMTWTGQVIGVSRYSCNW